MSILLFLILNKFQIISFKRSISKFGIITFLVGILATETILFLQGFLFLNGLTPISNYNLLLLIFSGLMVVGLFILFINQFKKETK